MCVPVYGGVTSPSGPGSLPPGLVSRRRNYGDDGASDTSSMASYDYNGMIIMVPVWFSAGYVISFLEGGMFTDTGRIIASSFG